MKKTFQPFGPGQYSYFINLDERGEFYADVRNQNDRTIFEIKGYEIFEDGFMKDKGDISGLTEYLRDLGLISKGATIQKGQV